MAIKVEWVVFLSLLLDLFAFTIPLPLFPRIIEWYTVRESTYPDGFLARTLRLVSGTRSFLLRTPAKNPQKWDIVLLGGFMGSIFSALQFVVSPHIGSLSDKYGRKRVLLITMLGNILSAVVWIQSTTFTSYMLSRVIGGLSEGNVQLAIAILSDVTSAANRSKALASVGIAFAICFCVGPPIGAYFASRPFPPNIIQGLELNIYATPAVITLVLLILETIFLAVALPETRFSRKDEGKPVELDLGDETAPSPAVSRSVQLRGESVQDRLQLLKTMSTVHLLFLGIFSGVEFTLTFLTFDREYLVFFTTLAGS
ncbi:MFS general substrate transporter [Thelephora ganbajun]|uniref:MFS general substrate transporter n=1 Tax=Thelephora ganbajun TaxID=370292 RepID=A0ACB6Z935_THEGA|nr:MFS general substrate transporter [Thelephora ganbajun]